MNKLINHRDEMLIDKITQSGIVGTDLYILYNDLCDREMDKVGHLVFLVPLHLLKAACSKQDRSGKELLNQYINW